MYKIPATMYRTEESIKRSRFIATVTHASTEKDVKNFISTIKNEFSDASHNCWAYVAGPPGDTARVGMSDDGEPHGGGRPGSVHQVTGRIGPATHDSSVLWDWTAEHR